jgi:hypothetical protein
VWVIAKHSGQRVVYTGVLGPPIFQGGGDGVPAIDSTLARQLQWERGEPRGQTT